MNEFSPYAGTTGKFVKTLYRHLCTHTCACVYMYIYVHEYACMCTNIPIRSILSACWQYA